MTLHRMGHSSNYGEQIVTVISKKMITQQPPRSCIVRYCAGCKHVVPEQKGMFKKRGQLVCINCV